MPQSNNEKIENLVIIGSGPAGWTAAIYAARASLAPLVFEGIPKQTPSLVLPGGQLMLTTDVENYPGFPEGISGPVMMDAFKKQAARFDTRIEAKDVVRLELSENPARTPHKLHTVDPSGAEGIVQAHAVIIATGATANWMNLENEQRLARSGGGVSACAVCDGALPMFRGKPLAVIGGGDSAMEEATYLTKFASRVYVVHRRDALRASKVMQKRYLEKENAEVLWNKVVEDVLGQDMISGLKLKDVKTGEESVLDIAGLFVAIGHTPATGFLADTPIETDEKGYIKLRTRHSATNMPGVFAAGDVADSEYRQAVTAAGMGCQAALDAERWLGGQGLV